ncbi:MAG: xanthine dehydrogenase family protein molybdopterin-binding subunit, partial [Pseudomonadota bacterium]
MGRLKTITRRAFLIGSVAVGGGVAFGTYMTARPHPNPLAGQLADGEASFNPWVKISPDQITLITPHADIGQGVVHMQAMIIGEEMDLEPGQYVTDFGAPDPAYYNTAFAEEAGEAIAATTPLSAGAASTVIGAVTKLLGIQGTGGSTSTTDSFDKLRMAGAVARETLKEAAAQVHGVPRSELTTANGKVILADGTEVAYTDLAAVAGEIPPVTDVALREPSEWRHIGKPSMREDVARKSTGTQNYGIDLELDGMVYAAVRVNPRRSGVTAYDASVAEGMRGVSGIVPVTNGVAVVADNTWRAFRAIEEV